MKMNERDVRIIENRRVCALLRGRRGIKLRRPLLGYVLSYVPTSSGISRIRLYSSQSMPSASRSARVAER